MSSEMRIVSYNFLVSCFDDSSSCAMPRSNATRDSRSTVHTENTHTKLGVLVSCKRQYPVATVSCRLQQSIATVGVRLPSRSTGHWENTHLFRMSRKCAHSSTSCIFLDFSKVSPTAAAFDTHGVATISRLLKIIGLFCRTLSLLWGSFAKETYNFKEPTNRSHPIANLVQDTIWLLRRQSDFCRM